MGRLIYKGKVINGNPSTDSVSSDVLSKMINDSKTASDSTWSSTKVSTALNTALTDYVKSYGNYKVGDETDLNKYLKSGFYRIGNISDYTNRPEGATSYSQLIVSRNGDTVAQLFLSWNVNKIFFRCHGVSNVSMPWVEVTTETVLNNALANFYKVKEVTATSSANGNIDLNLNGVDNIVLSVQSYNSEGINNDTMIIPFKLGDGKPQGSSLGRWGAHCCSSNSTMTVKANETIYCTVCYIEKRH
ncbi:MAG: pyocin knob domain-containing protein [Treponema sp.]|nr:pyocin knob domain-containing protein [Treponema sp.]